MTIDVLADSEARVAAAAASLGMEDVGPAVRRP